MERLGIAFSMLVLLGLVSAVPFAAGEEMGGVLLYAGFEDTGDGTAASGKVPCEVRWGDGTLHFEAGNRGKGVVSGDGLGYALYSPEGNIYPQQGTVEFWVCPKDWPPDDGKFHAFFQVQSPGFIWIYKYHQTEQLYFRLGADVGDASKVKIADANVSDWKPGDWHHIAATWSAEAQCLYVDGKLAQKVDGPYLPEALGAPIQVGDHPMGMERQAHTVMDELYIYDRALSPEEVTWAYAHAGDREAGKDLPVGEFPQAKRQAPLPVAAKPKPSDPSSSSNNAPAAAEQVAYKYERGGVLFYDGFDRAKDADYAAGNPKAQDREGGGSLTAAGQGKRDKALKTGVGEGFLEFSAEKNILPERGSIEFWMMPENWSSGDGHEHVIFEVLGEGGSGIRFREIGNGVQEFVVRSAPGEPRDYGDATPTLTSTAYGSAFAPNGWVHLVYTWEKDGPLGMYIGNFGGTGLPGVKCASPGKLTTIHIGDRPSSGGRTWIDEVYVYDRPLSKDEAVWTFEHSSDREPGTDVPRNFKTPTARAVPRPKNKEIRIKVDSGARISGFSGTAELQPAAGTKPAEVRPVGERFGEAIIPFEELPPGDYKILVSLRNGEGADMGTIQTQLAVPPPPVWLGNDIGLSDTPPPPFTPMSGSSKEIICWGRRYEIGALALPRQINAVGEDLLAAPVELRIVQDNKAVEWKQAETSLAGQSKVEIKLVGSAAGPVGNITSTAAAEYDGMIRYDLTLAPGGSVPVQSMELRFPIKQEYAQLYGLEYYSHGRGALPAGEGVVKQSGWQRACWLGNDERGLFIFAETDEAVDPWGKGEQPREPRQYGFRIERQGAVVTMIWSFALKGEGRVLTAGEPWKFTFGLLATPVKDSRAKWRHYRDEAPGANVVDLWPSPSWVRYYSPPEPVHVENFRNRVQAHHDRGMLVIPYSCLTWLSRAVPEYQWWQEEWGTGQDGDTSGDVAPFVGGFSACRPTREFIDYIVWKNEQLNRELDLDGIYIDWTMVPHFVYGAELGFGYVRDGVEHSCMPYFAVREIYKRVYTMLKEQRPDKIMVGHTSGNLNPSLFAFLDINLDGEGQWLGQLRDNYLDVYPLDHFRVTMGHQYGAIQWFLPHWNGAVLEDKDVGKRDAAGNISFVSVEKSHHLFGIGLLHDFGFWPICGTNVEASKQFYGVQDDFGMADAEFFGYWDNADLIAGQTEEIKASAYRKPAGGALVVIYNTTRQAQGAALSVDWGRLKSDRPLEVLDAYTKEPVAVSGNSLTLDVPPLNYRLLWVK